MENVLIARRNGARSIPIWFASAANWPSLRKSLDRRARSFAEASGFEPKDGRHLLLPDADGGVGGILYGIGTADIASWDRFAPGRLATLLPAGTYRFANSPPDERLAVIAFALGAYQFTRYRKGSAPSVRLELPEGVDARDVKRIAEAVTLARDLINTPSNDMGPAELERAARDLSKRHRAKLRVHSGEANLRRNFPLIHAVGKASTRPPRLIDFTWGNVRHPKVTLVGKGVCFDTGGLDIKPSSAMLLMKKDMGGAATVLALAHMVMDARLKLRLRVLVPAVENSVAGNAMRPLDVIRSRKGPTVEIGNTDAEGRLILADALALADEERPDLLVDFGTLTGAARVALGPDLPPFYTGDDTLAADLSRCAAAENDPLWRMPLWRPYDAMLESRVADFNNVSSGTFAGSITCALFLQRFVEAAKAWLHVDIYAWTPASKPGRPEGGECQAARAVYRLLSERYG